MSRKHLQGPQSGRALSRRNSLSYMQKVQSTMPILDGLGQPTNQQPQGIPLQALVPQFFLQIVPLMLNRDTTIPPEECVNRAWLVTRRTFNKLGLDFPEDQKGTSHVVQP